MKQLLLKSTIVQLMLIFGLTSQTYAATGSMIIGGTLVPDLSTNDSGTGWTWTAGTATISLTNTYAGQSIAINCQPDNVINLSYAGNISISDNTTDAIFCNGSLTIGGSTGTLSFTYTGNSYMFSAITTMELLTINSGNMNITCSASSMMDNDVIVGNAAAVYARKGFTITGNSDVTINATGSNANGFYTELGNSEISTTGTVTTNATGLGYPLNIKNDYSLSISNGTVNLSNNNTPGSMIWSNRSDFGFKMTGGIVKYNNGTPPSFTTLSPNSAPVAGGTPVILTGTGLSGEQTKVKVGDTNTSVTSGTTTQIQFTTPPGILGAVDLLVQGAGGVSVFKDAFTYTSATGIKDAMTQNGIIYAQGKNIIIKNIEPGNRLLITDITGKTVTNTVINDTDTSIPVTTVGIYIVRAGEQTAKVICK